MNLHSNAQDRRFRQRLVRRAIETRAPLLAASLDAYARSEGMDWRGLAAQLGCSPEALDRIALCHPPRPEQFAADVEAIADGHMDTDRLLNLLRRFQVLNVFADHPAEKSADHDIAPSGGILLAARDREESIEPYEEEYQEEEYQGGVEDRGKNEAERENAGEEPGVHAADPAPFTSPPAPFSEPEP